MPQLCRFLLAISVSLAVPAGAKAAPTTTKAQTKNAAHLSNALADAIEAGNVAQMEELFKRGASPNARDQRGYYKPEPDDGIPVIFGAIKAKSLSVLRLLVSKGANVNAEVDSNTFQDSDDLLFLYEDFTPLDYAAKLDQIEMVKLLIGAEAKTNYSTEVDTGQAFQVAAAYNALGAMRLLLETEDEKERVKSASGVIWWAAMKGNLEMVQLLVASGADKASCGRAMTEALRNQNLDIAFALLDHADLNVFDSKNETPLSVHTSQEWPEITSINQLTFGPDPKKMSDDERAKLQEAVDEIGRDRQRAADFIRAAVKAGAKPDMVGREGYTPLLMSIERGNLPFVEALLDSGGNPNFSPKPFPAPLRFLASSGNLSRLNNGIDNYTDGGITPERRMELQQKSETTDLAIAQLLLNKGVKLTSGDNRYALGEAVAHGNISLTRLLLKHGANPNLPFVPHPYFLTPMERLEMVMTSEEATSHENQARKSKAKFAQPTSQMPLFLACIGGRAQIVHDLLLAGANAKAQDSWGRNALHYLASGGRIATIRRWEQRVATIDEHNIRDSSLDASNLAEPLPTPQMKLLVSWASTGDGAICRELLAKGCSAQARDRNGRTPLQIALGHSDVAVVSAILAANPKSATSAGLFEVIQKGRRQSRHLPSLRKLQLDLTESDRIRLWPHETAKGHRDNELQAKRARIMALAQRSQLLHNWGEVDAAVISLLLKHGANPNISNAQGLTPLMLAARSGQVEVVRVLLAAKAKAEVAKGLTVLEQVSRFGVRTTPLPIDEETKFLSSEKRQAASSRKYGVRLEHQPRDTWMQPKHIHARAALVRHVLAEEDAAVTKRLRHSEAH